MDFYFILCTVHFCFMFPGFYCRFYIPATQINDVSLQHCCGSGFLAFISWMRIQGLNNIISISLIPPKKHSNPFDQIRIRIEVQIRLYIPVDEILLCSTINHLKFPFLTIIGGFYGKEIGKECI